MAVLQNIQTGQVTLSGTSVDATPSSYTPAQSILIFSYRGGSNNAARGSVKGLKVNGTTLRWLRNSSGGTAPIIEWQLMEFDADVSVEDISITYTATNNTETATISAVTLARAFIVPGGHQTVGGTALGDDDHTKWQYNSTTEIQIDRATNRNLAHSVEGQIVDFIGCSVQELDHTVSSGQTTTDTISSVTVGDTMIFASNTMSNVASGALFDRSSWRHRLQDATTVEFLREIGNGAVFNWTHYVIEFSDGTTLQQGLHTLANSDASDPITLSALVIAESTACLGTGRQWACSHGSNDNNDDDTRDAFLTSVLTATTTMTVTRDTQTGRCELYFQVPEWNVTAAAANDEEFAATSPSFSQPVLDKDEVVPY